MALAASRVVASDGLLEPKLKIAAGGDAPQVAVTLDACSGGIDLRILDVLVREQIKATLFVTGRWIAGNPEAMRYFIAHPELFELENHGKDHVPAVSEVPFVFGIKTAGSPEAIAAEINGGRDAIMASGGHRPGWYRGATARYSAASIAEIHALGFRLAGFSVNADYGASASAEVAAARMAAARDGDVIIAHINQPNRVAGAGVAAGLLALKARGVRFVLLNEVATQGD